VGGGFAQQLVASKGKNLQQRGVSEGLEMFTKCAYTKQSLHLEFPSSSQGVPMRFPKCSSSSQCDLFYSKII